MPESDTRKTYPAYVSYKSFLRFLKGLQPGHLPTSINSSVLSGMSGSVQSAIQKTLEFLGLTVDNKPTAKLEALVAAQGPDFAQALSKVLHDAYPFIFNSGIDLKRTTTQDVAEAFRKQGIQGSTTVKAMAFFLSACKDAGIQVSPYVKTPTLAKPNGGKKSASKGVGETDDDEDDDEQDDEERGARRAPPMPEMDPALLSLITKLPEAGEPMSKKDRERYVAFFRSVLDLMYPEAEDLLA